MGQLVWDPWLQTFNEMPQLAINISVTDSFVLFDGPAADMAEHQNLDKLLVLIASMQLKHVCLMVDAAYLL